MNNMLKIVHLQYATFSAGRAALRLHNAFLEENYDSSILSLRYDINDTDKLKHVGLKSTIKGWIDNKMQSFLTRNNNKQFGQYSFPILGTNVSKLDQIKNADVIYFHWINGGFLNLTNIEQLAKLGKPIIIFMHDMWSITGGCHHSFTCEKYKTRCADCQMFPSNKMIDWPAWEFNKKRKLYSKYSNLYFVTPSKWLYDCTKQASFTKEKPVFYIPNIIDNKLFKPFDKNSARHILNLDINEIIISFGAASIDSPYKGWLYLQKAMELLQKSQNKKEISVLIFGSGLNKKIADTIPFKSRFMGFLRDEYSTALIYNSSDIFITPSLADNQPTTVMESMCCGTPVVGFDVGGIPDMIMHKENGYLAKYKDAEDLANGVMYCLENNIKGRMLPFFEKSNIIKKHIELINSII